jgi:hypothetical protein
MMAGHSAGSAGVRLRSGQESDGMAMFGRRNHASEIWDGESGMDGGLEEFFLLLWMGIA